jgi:hypothetical protein
MNIEPLKMDLTNGSETSAKHNLTPGKYPKERIQDSEHGKNLKSRNHKQPHSVGQVSESYNTRMTNLFL